MVMPFPSSREEDRNYIGRSNRYDQYSRPPEDNYARSTKRPSTPPPGVPFTNPNVARYQEHVEQHINRSVSPAISPQPTSTASIWQRKMKRNKDIVEPLDFDGGLII